MSYNRIRLKGYDSGFLREQKLYDRQTLKNMETVVYALIALFLWELFLQKFSHWL